MTKADPELEGFARLIEVLDPWSGPGTPEDDGVIIYLKPTLVSSDPCELLGYGAVNNKFPNDSTADQWFGESHFESYRALGHVVATASRDTVASEMNRLLALGPS